MSTQGAEANRSGQFLRNLIESEFRSRGVPIFDYQGNRNNGDLLAPHFLIRRAPHPTIYTKFGGQESQSDDFVYRQFWDVNDIRIICRYQENPGSADQKFPFLLLSARDVMRENEIWIVVDGQAYSPQSIAWLRHEASEVSHKKIAVMNAIEARKAIKGIVASARRASS